MKKIIEVLKNKDYDRYIFLHIDESKFKEYADGIYGISFHQGLDVVLWEYSEINPHLTEIWRRLTLNYPNVDTYKLINDAIELYCDAFIHQDKHAYNIPSPQLALIQKALKYYVEQSAKFNSCPTDTEAYEIFDMNQLSAMMNYQISITISEEDKNKFAITNGMDFPQY